MVSAIGFCRIQADYSSRRYGHMPDLPATPKPFLKLPEVVRVVGGFWGLVCRG